MHRSRWIIAAVVSLSAVALPAQSARDSTSLMLRGSFDEVSGWLLRTAEIVPAERYDYRPSAGVRTVGEMLAHVVDAYAYYCPNAAGRATPWAATNETQGPLDKATIQRKLKAATEACVSAHDRGAALPLLKNITHAPLHYGNLITYLRMMGLTPPSS